MGDFSHICGMMCMTCAVRFIVFLKSCVSCQALAEALKQNSTVTTLILGGAFPLGDEGANAWYSVRMGSWGGKAGCLVRMGSWEEREWRNTKEGSRHSCLKVKSGKYWEAMQGSVDSQICHVCDRIQLNQQIRLGDFFVFAVFRDGKNYGTDFFSHNCDKCVMCPSPFFSSHVSTARPWPRPWNRTPFWRIWFWRITTLALKVQRLGVWSVWGGWCHEGSWSKERQRKDQDMAVWKWHSGNDKRRCNAALTSRCIHPLEFCDDMMTSDWGIFMCFGCIGQILVEKRHNS